MINRISRIELLLLTVLFLTGFVLRVWNLSSVGLDHFDEGAYVFSALGLTDPQQPHRLYPNQIRFSPPLYFSLVGLAYKVFGHPSDMAAFLVNVIFGTLTILVVWWLGRSWFNPPAGIAAASLLAFNEFHISLSRSALTDITFAFFFFLSLGAIVETIKRQKVTLAILSGLLIGLTWNTKYHGWLALVIGILAFIPYSYFSHTSIESFKKAVYLFVVMGIVAGISFLPWVIIIQSQPGGYFELAKYQRTMLSLHWLRDLWRQIQQQLFFEGPFSRLSVLIAVSGALILSGWRERLSIKFVVLIVFLSLSAMLIGGAGTVALLTLISVPIFLRRSTTYSSWIIMVGVGIFALITPFYHPYARLVLPLVIFFFLSGGFWLSYNLSETRQVIKSIPWKKLISVSFIVLAVIALDFSIPTSSNPWRPSRSEADASVAMEKIIPPGSRVVVIGEPSVAFYLNLANRPAFERIEDPEEIGKIQTPVYLVTGIYTKVAPSLRDGLEKLNDRLVLLGKFPVEPKDLRLLDDLSPEEASTFISKPNGFFDLTLYQLNPPKP
jgi:4-amino-4-deoxy-L-arabinose transferase-like glycosyltransferase